MTPQGRTYRISGDFQGFFGRAEKKIALGRARGLRTWESRRTPGWIAEDPERERVGAAGEDLAHSLQKARRPVPIQLGPLTQHQVPARRRDRGGTTHEG